MTLVLLSVSPSLQRIKFLTYTCLRACASAARFGCTGCRTRQGCGLFKVPPPGLPQAPGPDSRSSGAGSRGRPSQQEKGVSPILGWGTCLSGRRARKGVAPPSRHRGWGYVWVTWRLLGFGRVSAASAPGEEAVTTREIVAVAAAGGREESEVMRLNDPAETLRV